MSPIHHMKIDRGRGPEYKPWQRWQTIYIWKLSSNKCNRNTFFIYTIILLAGQAFLRADGITLWLLLRATTYACRFGGSYVTIERLFLGILLGVCFNCTHV